MTPTGPDTLLAATDAGPSLWYAALRVTAAIALMLGGAWAWFYWQRRVRGPVRRLEILDRAILGRGASIALLRVDDRNLLVGVSTDGVRLIRDVDTPPATAARGGGAAAERSSPTGQASPSPFDREFRRAVTGATDAEASR